MAEVNNIGKPPVIFSGQIPNASTPICLSPCENPITWVFESELIGSSSSVARAFFQFTGAVTAGQTITVNGKVYEAATNPDLGEFKASATPATVAASFKQALEDDPTLNYKYRITITGGNFISLEAYKPGSKYTITASTTSGGVAVFGITSGTDKKRSQTLANWSAWVEVWANLSGPTFGVQGVSNARLLRRLELPANEADRYAFDVSAVVRSLVEGTLPTTAVVGFGIQQTAAKSYFLRYGEQFTPTGGSAIQRIQVGQTIPAYVLNMALPLLDRPAVNAWAYDNGRPLSYLNPLPARKLSRRDAMEWLYLLYVPQTTAARWLSLYVQIVWVDGTTSSKFFTKTAAAIGGVLFWRVDYQSLQLGTLASTNGKEVLRWTVEVVEHGGSVPVLAARNTVIYTKVQSYVLSENCEPRPLLLVWLNSLGGWDSFSFDGFQDRSAEIDKATFERALPIEFPAHRRSEKVRAVTSSQTFEVYTFRSELIDEDHHQFLLELFASPSVYLWSGSDFLYVAEISGKWERMGADYLHQVEGRFRLTIPKNFVKE